MCRGVLKRWVTMLAHAVRVYTCVTSEQICPVWCCVLLLHGWRVQSLCWWLTTDTGVVHMCLPLQCIDFWCCAGLHAAVVPSAKARLPYLVCLNPGCCDILCRTACSS